MFVQDFVRVERPLAAVINAFEREVAPRLGEFVRAAWKAERDGTELDGSESHIRTTAGDAEPVAVSVGPRRVRPDGVVYALGWPAGGSMELPEFDADLELTTLTPTKTHVELSGQSRFPSIERWSSEDRQAHRHGLAAVAGLLLAVAGAIESVAEAPN